MSVQLRAVPDGRRRSTRAAEEAAARALLVELSGPAGPGVDAGTLRILIRETIRDLRGSVSAEALPEMAARLAQHRGAALRLAAEHEGTPGSANLAD